MSSSVPSVIPALQALAVSALPQGAQVWLGSVMPVYQPGPGDTTGVVSGITLMITGARFDADQFAELGPSYKHEEHYNIACLLCAWIGQGDAAAYAQCLQDVYTEYANLSVAIANAPTLNLSPPNPRLAWTRQLGVTIAPDALGRASAEIQFEVQVQARVPSLS